MKIKIIAILGALILALGLTVGGALAPTASSDSSPVVKAVVPAPAAAAWGTDVWHAADDGGYVADIHIVCTDGRHRWLPPGKGSWSTGYSCGYGGVQSIYAGYNQAVRCFNALPPYQSAYFVGGYREVPSYASLKCYMQRPL